MDKFYYRLQLQADGSIDETKLEYIGSDCVNLYFREPDGTMSIYEKSDIDRHFFNEATDALIVSEGKIETGQSILKSFTESLEISEHE